MSLLPSSNFHIRKDGILACLHRQEMDGPISQWPMDGNSREFSSPLHISVDTCGPVVALPNLVLRARRNLLRTSRPTALANPGFSRYPRRDRRSVFRPRNGGSLLGVPIWMVLCLKGQDDIGTLVDRLHADSAAEREGAGRGLAAIGESARAAVEKAAKHPEPEVARRAAEVLRILEFRKAVPPRLKASVRGIEGRIVSGGARVWTQAFLEVLGYRSRGDEFHLPDSIEPGDLDFLVVRALRGGGDGPRRVTPHRQWPTKSAALVALLALARFAFLPIEA